MAAPTPTDTSASIFRMRSQKIASVGVFTATPTKTRWVGGSRCRLIIFVLTHAQVLITWKIRLKIFHHACVRCNSLKSDKWPSKSPTEPHDGTVGFIDPFSDDRRRYFKVADDGELLPLRPPALYLIRVLALNRRHLKLLRLRRILNSQLRAYFAENSERWTKAARGEGGMTLEEAGQALMECKRLFELCSFGRSA